MHLSRHIFEQWVWSILKFALLNLDAQCGRQKIVFSGLFTHLLSFSIFDCSKVPYLYLWRGMLCKLENDFYSFVGFQCEYLRTQKLGDFFL